jgi:quercetin dioxygenase-like cupin family protein
MFPSTARDRFGRTLVRAGVVLSASLITSAVSAGECPAD